VLRLACGISAPPRARRVGHMRTTITEGSRRARALPISQSVIRTPISAAAYDAIAPSSMRLLLEAQRGPQGGYFLCLDQVTLNQLMAAKRPSEDLSGLVVRIAKAEAMASNRSPNAIAFRA
jgi:hypothetical protein